MVFLKEFFQKVNFEKKSADNKKNEKIKQKVSKAHITPAVAIKGHATLIRKNTTLIRKKEKWINKGTDKQYVAKFFIHSTTCHI